MTEIESILRAIGLTAVIAGTVLVVFQVRVHAKNVRSRNAFDLIAKVIDPSSRIDGICCTRSRRRTPVAIGLASIAVCRTSR